MSKPSLALGVPAGIGGFADTGRVVASTTAGATFRHGLAWAAIVGFAVNAEISARIAICSSPVTWDLIRLRLGPRLAIGRSALKPLSSADRTGIWRARRASGAQEQHES